MKSTITSKFQITIPKAVRDTLKLSIKDTLEWEISEGKVMVYPVQKKFLGYRNKIKVGPGDIGKDIEKARNIRMGKKR
jgi:AbrB family looped-hinge helix DNA binding protein